MIHSHLFRRGVFAALASLLALPLMAAPDGFDKEARERINAYVEAVGGKEVFARTEARKMTATTKIPAQGLELNTVIYARKPNHVLVEQEIPGLGKARQGYDGETAWAYDSMQGYRELSGAEYKQLVESSMIDRDVRLMEIFDTGTYLGTEELEGFGEVAKVELAREDGTKEVWYFDTETDLVVRVDMTIDQGPMGSIPVTNTFQEYREVDGLKFPHRLETRNPAFNLVTEVEEVEHNVSLDDVRFGPPEAYADQTDEASSK